MPSGRARNPLPAPLTPPDDARIPNGGPPPDRPDVEEQRRLAAKSTMEDFTRNVQRKKDREMEALQFVGGDADSKPAPVASGAKTGRNDPCPCGSGKKYKKCHGS